MSNSNRFKSNQDPRKDATTKIQKHATVIREKVDAEKRITTSPNTIVDLVTVEVYNRLFGGANDFDLYSN